MKRRNARRRRFAIYPHPPANSFSVLNVMDISSIVTPFAHRVAAENIPEDVDGLEEKDVQLRKVTKYRYISNTQATIYMRVFIFTPLVIFGFRFFNSDR